MADALTPVAEPGAEPESAPVAARRCRNCDAELAGPFCAACGQEDKPLDPPVRHFARDFAQELFDVDNRVVGTLRRLVFSPGFLTVDHYEGRRARWLSPLKVYLLTSVAAFTALAFTETDAGLRIAVFGMNNADPADLAWTRPLGYATADELGRALATAREVWIPRVMFLLVPLFACLVGLVRRASARHYPAHLVFALHVHAAVFAVRAVATTVGFILPAAATPWLDTVVLVYAVGQAFMALRRVYGLSRLRAALDLSLVAVVHWLAVLILSGVVVLTAVLGPEWPAKFGGWTSR